MANKNIFKSLLSTITTIGSLSIMASCGYDAYKTAKNTANADVYNLNLQTQFNNPINANALINSPYQQAAYLNVNQPSNLQNIAAKTKGWFKGLINSLSRNFITLSTAALGVIFNRNYFGKLFFGFSIASILGKNLINGYKKLNKQANSFALTNQIPFSETDTRVPVANVPLSPVGFANPTIPVGTPQIVGPAYPYIPCQPQIRLY